MFSVERNRPDTFDTCPICGETLTSKRNYYRHLKNHEVYQEQRNSSDTDNHTEQVPREDEGMKTVDNVAQTVDDLMQTEVDVTQPVDADGMETGDSFSFSEELNESHDGYVHLEDDVDTDDLDDGDMDGNDDEEEDSDPTPETWEDVSEEELEEDLGLPVNRRSGIKSVNDLLFWFLYFILYWQNVCHITDSAIEWLLRFLFQFFNVLSLKINHSILAEFSTVFRTSLYMLRKLLNVDRNNFERYVVCQECFTVYDFFDCFVENNGVKKTNFCTHETFIRGRAKICNAPLLKEVILKGGIVKLYPYKVYCYNSLINGIEHILQKHHYPDLLNHWKDWTNENVFRDVYDGKVWSDFKDFFIGDRNLGLMLNIDWFQPFKNRTDYSVGVIYFVILNLPRNIRYKFENVIVVGLIPALKKEPKDLSPFLTPIVKELQSLWKGVVMKTSLSSIALTIRAALICVACDIPAARKTCGFKSHSAVLGCHRCFKNFPAASFGAKRNYSGFDRQNWKLRSKQLHNQYAKKVKNAKNITEFNKLSRKFGTYYSVLIELDYFDAIRFCIIDPMHNLFLGTAKSMFTLWKKKEILDESKLELIENRLRSMNDVTDIGRIPHKISSNYGCYNAVEWKNWTVIFSLYCLCGILPDAHFKVWEKFVLACRVLCSPFLTALDITKADQLLLNFCTAFEEVYSWEDVKPNMHLHCHLKECLLDFGPIHVFWCFSFERFNGKFGQFKTNNRCVEVQFMKQLVTTRHCEKLSDAGIDNEFYPFFNNCFENENLEFVSTPEIVNFLNFSKSLNFDLSASVNTTNVKAPDAYKVKTLDVEDMIFLLDGYRHMYPSKDIQLSNLSEVIRKCGHLNICGERFGSKMECRSVRSANVLASWHGKDGDIDLSVDTVGLKPCRIDFFFSHVVYIDGTNVRHFFAKVSWYKEYSERNKYGSHLQLWLHKQFDIAHGSSFLPVERIRCRFAYGITGHSKDLMLVSPIPRKIFSDCVTD